MKRDLHEQNRRSWNLATVAHNRHKGDQAGFLRSGGSTLFAEELSLLGELAGRRLAHLQCNAGQDTLSLAARGADAVGVDISDEAIAFARALATESGIAAQFERADVYDWLAEAPPGFDVVFASYGALCWLSDLTTWARGVARVLRPGGRLVILEFHPVLNLLDEHDGRMVFGPTRGGGGALLPFTDGIPDYVALSGPGLLPDAAGAAIVDAPFANPETSHEFEWSVADVVDAVARAGLVIETVREWPWANGCRFFPSMIDLGGKRWGLPADAPAIPLMYGLAARRS